VESILLVLGAWWWVAPVVVGAGAASFAALTTRRRRSRRLELDAARHEESQAYRALVAAKARVRVAQADVLSARSRSATPAAAQAKRELQAAKQSEKSASLALRASRSRVKAGRAQYSASASKDPLPIERLYRAHDAVNSRWLEYDTDIDKALRYPQLTDPRHPATVVFLRAQREALNLRPLLPDRVTPEQYLDYRIAVNALEVALIDAERQAGVPGTAPAPTAAPAVTAALTTLAELWPTLIARVDPTRDRQDPPDRAP